MRHVKAFEAFNENIGAVTANMTIDKMHGISAAEGFLSTYIKDDLADVVGGLEEADGDEPMFGEYALGHEDDQHGGKATVWADVKLRPNDFQDMADTVETDYEGFIAGFRDALEDFGRNWQVEAEADRGRGILRLLVKNVRRNY